MDLCVLHSFPLKSLTISEKKKKCLFVSPDDDEEEQICPFVEDMTSTSATPKLPPCLQEEEKESDSDSEGPIQYRDEEEDDDDDESYQSKNRRGKYKGKLFCVVLGTWCHMLGSLCQWLDSPAGEETYVLLHGVLWLLEASVKASSSTLPW